MTLAERLAAPPSPAVAQTAIERWIDGLPAVDREAVLKALANPDWKHTDLLAALKAEGAPKMSVSTLGRWRKTLGWSK